MQIFISLCFAVLFGFAGVQASFSNALSGFVSTMSGIGNGFKQFGEGMAQSFGAAPSGYHYSFRVFNNTIADTVTTSWNNLVQVQGMIFNEGTSSSTIKILPPYTDTDSLYSKIKLYLEVEVSFANNKGSFTNPLVNAVDTYADPSGGLSDPVDWYNVYTQVDKNNGTRVIVGPQVEYIGVTGPNSLSDVSGSYVCLTTDFNALIYNGVNQKNNITFSFAESASNQKKYTVTLDELSFNFLTSDPSIIPNPFRPINGFSYLTFSNVSSLVNSIPIGSQNSIPITPQTFGTASWNTTTSQVISDSTAGTGLPSNSAMRSNYEVFNNNGVLEVIQTGYTPGTYLVNSGSAAEGVSPVNALGSIKPSYWSIIPISSQMRDITPVRCLIWNQSASQYIAQLAAQGDIDSGTTSVTNQIGAPFVPYDDLNSTLWFVYYSPGWSTDSQVKSNGVLQTASNGVTWAAPKSMPGLLLGQVPSGQAVSFSIIRPSVNYKCSLTSLEGAQWTIPAAPVVSTPPTPPPSSPTSSGTTTTPASSVPVITPPSFLPLTISLSSAARLSIVSLNTTDPKKAEQFLIRLASEKIKFSVFTPPVLPEATSTPPPLPTLSYSQQSSLLTKPLPTNINYLTDKASGVTGVLLASDIFSSYESSSGPFYYTLYPPQADLYPIMSTLINYVPSSIYKDNNNNFLSSFTETVAEWVLSVFNPANTLQTIQATITSYLQTNGNNELFISTGSGSTISYDKTKFSNIGTMAVQQIVYGPGGVLNPLKFLMAGINNSVWTYGNTPNVLEFADGETRALTVSTWNPANTVPVG